MMKLKQRRQNGAVLILTLVVLLMLTFYGVVSTRDAKTQYQIAGNAQAYSVALAEAEGVLTKAENSINCLRRPSVKIAVTDGTLTSVDDSCTAVADPDYLSTGENGDISKNKIMIETISLYNKDIDSDDDGVDDSCFRVENYRITVLSNHPKSGRREVRSDYVVTATDSSLCVP